MPLDVLGRYYDTAPRPLAGVEADDVQAVIARQRELGVPESLKWVARGTGAAIAAPPAHDARSRGTRTVFLSAQDDAVARVHERAGFRRVGTACTAAPPDPRPRTDA